MAVRIRRIDLHRLLEVPQRLLLPTPIEVRQTQAVPRPRIRRVRSRRRLQRLLSLRQTSQVQQGNPLVQQRNRRRHIRLVRLVELRQRLIGELLIHKRNADIVQPRRLKRCLRSRSRPPSRPTQQHRRRSQRPHRS